MARRMIHEDLNGYIAEDRFEVWVENALNRGDSEYDSFGIERQLAKLREYSGWLTDKLEDAGIVNIQEVLEHFGKENVCTIHDEP